MINMFLYIYLFYAKIRKSNYGVSITRESDRISFVIVLMCVTAYHTWNAIYREPIVHRKQRLNGPPTYRSPIGVDVSVIMLHVNLSHAQPDRECRIQSPGQQFMAQIILHYLCLRVRHQDLCIFRFVSVKQWIQRMLLQWCHISVMTSRINSNSTVCSTPSSG